MGKYFIYFSTINILATILVFGSNTYLLRETSNNNELKKNIMSISLINIIFMILIVYALFFLKIINLNYFNCSIIISSISLSFFKIISDYYKSKKSPALSQFFEFSILPIIIIVNLTLQNSSIEYLLYSSSLSYLFFSLLILVYSKLSFSINFSFYLTNKIDLFNLSLIAGINSLYASFPYLIFPLFLSLEQIGIFGLAHKIISISGSIIMALSSVYNVKFASLYSVNKLVELKNSFNDSQKISLLIYFLFSVLVLLSKNLLIYTFGDNFLEAFPVLFWMLLIRYVSVYYGMSEHVLNMTKNETYEIRSSSFSILICLFLVLINGYFSIFGSVISFGIIFSLMFLIRSCISYFFVKKLIY